MLDRTIAYGLDFMFPIRDQAIGANLALFGEFARPIIDFLLDHAASDTGRLIDAGANIGSISIPFACMRRQWGVTAIEPHRGLSSLLAANALNNRLTNIDVVQAAVGASRGIVDFPSVSLDTARNFGTLSLADPGPVTTPTLMLTLDDLEPEGVRLVKIDVEGHDADALRGAPRLLHNVRPIWFVEAAINQYPQTSRDVIQTLLEADYNLYWFFAPWTSSHGLKGRRPKEIGTGDPNIVALPRGAENRWGLPPVIDADTPYPGGTENYPYMARYWPGL
jgi:FkbM family methyltransferase